MRSTVMCEPSTASFFLTAALAGLNFSALRKCSQRDSNTFKYQEELLESNQKERFTVGWTISPNDVVSEMFEIGDVKRQIFVSNDPTGNVRWHWPRHFVIREFTHTTTACFLFLSAVAQSESNRLDSTRSTDSDRSKETSSELIGPALRDILNGSASSALSEMVIRCQYDGTAPNKCQSLIRVRYFELFLRVIKMFYRPLSIERCLFLQL